MGLLFPIPSLREAQRRWKTVQWTVFGFDRKTNVPVARL
jgi:hypothetical protein